MFVEDEVVNILNYTFVFATEWVLSPLTVQTCLLSKINSKDALCVLMLLYLSLNNQLLLLLL